MRIWRKDHASKTRSVSPIIFEALHVKVGMVLVAEFGGGRLVCRVLFPKATIAMTIRMNLYNPRPLALPACALTTATEPWASRLIFQRVS